MTYQEGIEHILNYTAGASIGPVLDFIRSLHSLHKDTVPDLDEIGMTNQYPDSLEAMLLYLGIIIHRRAIITQLYEKSMDRYQQVSTMTGNRRPTDDEARIKEFLTDYILKVEKLYEVNDLTDESIVKELNRFAVESNLANLTESELQKTIISSKTMTLLEPHLDRLREIYYGYDKLLDPVSRLIRIADFVLEEGNRKVS